jgi:hypothetical protein
LDFMNRLVVVLSTAIIILSVVSGFLFYQLNTVHNELRSQNAELQNQIDTIEARLSNYPPLVKIAEVKAYGFDPWGGMTIRSAVDVTIENIGVNDVENLSLTAVHSSSENYPHIKNVDVLHSGETRKINTYVWWVATTIGNITVTLNLGNDTFDEYILENYNIPPFQ